MLWLGPFPRRAAASPTRKTKHTSNYVGRVQLGNLLINTHYYTYFLGWHGQRKSRQTWTSLASRFQQHGRSPIGLPSPTCPRLVHPTHEAREKKVWAITFFGVRHTDAHLSASIPPGRPPTKNPMFLPVSPGLPKGAMFSPSPRTRGSACSCRVPQERRGRSCCRLGVGEASPTKCRQLRPG